jgi:hypothetical protein
MVRRVGVVGRATRYGLDGQGTNPGGGRDFPRLVQTGSEPHPASCDMVSGLFLGEGGSGRVVALTTHPHLAPRLKKE